jgi:tetratricopeptide (TPR) repeat protein
MIRIAASTFALLLLAACAEDGASPATQTATDSQTTTATAPATPATQPGLSLRDIRQPVIDHQYQVAITICDEIIENYQKKLAQDQAEHADKSPIVNLVGLDQITLSAAYSAKAQIYALMGEFSLANQAIDDADRVITIGNPVSNITRGFILEKQGDLAGAAKLYEADMGVFMGDGAESRDRLALLAIKAGNVEDAKKYLGSDEAPTQQIVLGLIAIAEKDPDKAAADFKRASDLIADPGTGNPTLPISYCEEVPALTK